MSVKDALENERRFFTNHKDYTARAKTLGIPYLTKRLNVILV
jgi:hypothetical protein